MFSTNHCDPSKWKKKHLKKFHFAFALCLKIIKHVLCIKPLVNSNYCLFRKEIEVDQTPSILEILDTAGTEQFASMRDLYIKNGQGFILVYSLVNQQSFQDIKPMREQICRLKGSDRVPIVLVGNKVSDLNLINIYLNYYDILEITNSKY